MVAKMFSKKPRKQPAISIIPGCFTVITVVNYSRFFNKKKVNKFTCFAFINSYKLFTVWHFDFLWGTHRLSPCMSGCMWDVHPVRPVLQIERTPPGLLAVWAFLYNCSQITSPSLVHSSGVRVNREEEGELWSNPPRPKQHQEGERGGEPQPAAAAAAAASQPRSQPAWASWSVS